MDTLKALAIIAVIIIHTAGAYLSRYQSPNSWDYNLNLAVNQLLRFCVPLFVALSGYGLAKGYPQINNIFSFWFRRGLKILPQFIFWSSVFYLINTFYPTFWGINFLLQPFYKTILLGRADYHLYFVPMIFSLYLIYPLLIILVKKFPILFLISSFFFQAIWYWRIGQITEIYGNWNSIFPDAQQYISPFSWIFYFVLGIYLSLKPRSLTFISLLTTVIFLGFSVFNMFASLDNRMDIIVATRFTRIPVLLYATSFIILAFSSRISHLAFLNYLGRISFTVYLIHTLILRLVFQYLPIKDLGIIITNLIVIILSFFLAMVVNQLGKLLSALIPKEAPATPS